MSTEKPTDQQVEELEVDKLDAQYLQYATEATLLEHQLTRRQNLKIYWKGALWSIFVSLCIIMRAYDIEIMGNFYALPSFQHRFGKQLPSGEWQVPAKWQVALNYGNTVGQIVGPLLVTYPMDWFGRRKTLMGYLAASACLVFMQFFAPNIHVLTGSEYLCGIVWGGYMVIAPTYASECLSLGLRPYLTGYINLCYVMGQFIQTGVTRGFLSRTDQWAYRIPFAIQWVWPVVIIFGLLFAPESPWWLIRKDRHEEAEKMLTRLMVKNDLVEPQKQIAMMIRTDQVERELGKGLTFWDCFKGPNRRRTEISVVVYVLQNFSGNPVGYATYFFEQVGLDVTQAFDMGIGLNALGFVGTCTSIIPLIYLGHRTIFIWGFAVIIVILFVVALLCFAHNYHTDKTYGWVQAVLLVVLTFVWQFAQGPLAYIISTEAPSARLRARTLGIASCLDSVAGIVTTVLGPYLLNPGALNTGAKSQFFYGGMSILFWTWCFFRLPEMKGRTYEELDLMFERRIPTRKFGAYEFDEVEHVKGEGVHVEDTVREEVHEV